MHKLYSFYYKLSVLRIILIGAFLPIILSSLVGIIYELLRKDIIEVWWLSENMTVIIVAGVIIAPLFETLFFQYLPLKICQKWFCRYRYGFCITIVLTSIIFAAMHKPEIWYFFGTLFAGLIWGFSCFVLMRKKRNPLLYTVLIHACYNCIVIISGLTL